MSSDALLQSILDASDIGLTLLDEKGSVLLWNAWMARQSGIPAATAVGRTLDHLFSPPGCLPPAIGRALEAALERGISTILCTTRHPSLFPLTGPEGESLRQRVVIKPAGGTGGSAPPRCLIQVEPEPPAEPPPQGSGRRLGDHYLRAIVEGTAEAVISFDDSGCIDTCNPAAAAMFGIPADVVTGKPIGLLVPELIALLTVGPAILERFISQRSEALARRSDGVSFPIELSVSPVTFAGRHLHVAIANDISARKQAESDLRDQRDWLTTLINALPDIVCFKDGEGRWRVANDFYLELFRLTGVDYQGRTGGDLAHLTPLYECFLLGALESDAQAWTEARPLAFEQIIPLPDGSEKIFDMLKIPLFHADGSRKGLVVLGRDVTEKKIAAARIHHLAHHDPLTGLPNRALFQDRLRGALAQARRSGGQIGLLVMDLDKLKDVNDTLGHHVGDRLLRAVAKRLERCVRETDTVARLGGDEFAVLLTNLTSVDGASTVAESILRAIAEPFGLDDNEVVTSISLGITVFPEDAEDAEALLKNADLALYRSKSEGRARYHFYVAEMDLEVQRRKSIERDLRHALGTEQLTLFYQPQIDLKTGAIIGAEALIRWYHPERGPVPPAMFIPIAERTDLIFPLGRWVLLRACQQINAWRKAGLAPLKVAVNLSPAQFRHHDLLDTIKNVLEQTGVDPRQIQLEITETIAMTNFDYSVEILRELRRLGLTIAIDDFGTGYSSLNYLKRFPVDKLKIDRSFVTDLGLHPDNAAIARAIISLGHGIGARVNVEGVETAEQLSFMRNHGCDECQGFFFSRPLPPADYQRLVSQPVPWHLPELESVG